MIPNPLMMPNRLSPFLVFQHHSEGGTEWFCTQLADGTTAPVCFMDESLARKASSQKGDGWGVIQMSALEFVRWLKHCLKHCDIEGNSPQELSSHL